MATTIRPLVMLAYACVFTAFAQENHFEQLEVRNGRVRLGNQEIPIFNGAELERKLREDQNGAGYVIVEKNPDGYIELRYQHDFPQDEKTNWKTLEKKSKSSGRKLQNSIWAKRFLALP